MGCLKPHLAQMAEGSGGRYEAEDILWAIKEERCMAWGGVENDALLVVAITEVVHYPRAKALRFIGLSGSRPRRWMHLVRELEQLARDNGCTLMEALHTPGHERLLRTGGWRVFHYLSEKKL